MAQGRAVPEAIGDRRCPDGRWHADPIPVLGVPLPVAPNRLRPARKLVGTPRTAPTLRVHAGTNFSAAELMQ
jgi:hypothetical protein